MSLAAPYPGTFLYKQAVENGWLDAEHAELVDEHGVQIAPLHYPHLSHAGDLRFGRDLLQRFYFRAGKIASIVGEMVPQPGDDEAPPARGRRVLPLPARARTRALTSTLSRIAGEGGERSEPVRVWTAWLAAYAPFPFRRTGPNSAGSTMKVHSSV